MTSRMLAALTLSLIACSQRPEPKLATLYNRAAQSETTERIPVIVIPGLLGSKLVERDSKELIWGAFTTTKTDPDDPEGARLIALPMEEGKPLAELVDDIESGGALDRVKFKLFGVPIEIAAYRNILETLGVGGYVDSSIKDVDYGSDHFTCFQFDYDWRRDNVENALRLAKFIEDKERYVKEEYRKRFGIVRDNVRFHIVAHSMGGLIARYYLMYGGHDLPADGSLPVVTWEGAQHVERVVLVGTPNAGASQSLWEYVYGSQLPAVLPAYPAAILGTFPSGYQLLPRDRHHMLVDKDDPLHSAGDPLDVETWERYHWGLLDPRQDAVLAKLLPNAGSRAGRLRIAHDHLVKSLTRARQVTAALDRPVPPKPSHVALSLVAGDAVATTRGVLSVDAQSGALANVKTLAGDGTVPRYSALLDDRMGGQWHLGLRSPIPWDAVLFLFANHLDLTRSPEFNDNVLFWLLEQDAPE